MARRVQLSMAFLFDTDAISELMKPRPDEGYLAWLATVARDDQFASAITIGERDVVRLTALDTHAIVSNHPFVDGFERFLRDHVRSVHGS